MSHLYRFLAETGICIHHCVQTEFGTHLASYPVGTAGKAAGTLSYTSTPPYIFMA